MRNPESKRSRSHKSLSSWLGGLPAMTVLLAMSVAMALATGCGAKKTPVTPEQSAFILHKENQAREYLALKPPQADKAREAALDVLAVVPESVEARLLLADAEFALMEYKESLEILEPLEKRGIDTQELLIRKARALYYYHTYWTRGNYAKARQTARLCVQRGDDYIVECYQIIRNSYLGEVQGDPAEQSAAAAKAVAASLDLLTKIETNNYAYADTCLQLAEDYFLLLNRPGDGERYLKKAKDLSADRPQLQRRIASFERERELQRVLDESKK